MNPRCRPIGPMFFLPDGNDFLASIDQPLASGERIGPVRGAHGHGNTNLLQIEPSQTVNNRHAFNGPSFFCLLSQLFHLGLRHGAERFVFQKQRPCVSRKFANGSQKENGSPARRRCNGREDRPGIDDFVSQANHARRPFREEKRMGRSPKTREFSRPASAQQSRREISAGDVPVSCSHQPPLTGGKTATSASAGKPSASAA